MSCESELWRSSSVIGQNLPVAALPQTRTVLPLLGLGPEVMGGWKARALQKLRQFAAPGDGELSKRYSLHCVLPAKQRIPEVEPRGVEPLTSAVQMLAPVFSVVSGRCQSGIDKRISLIYRQWKLATVNPGRCQISVRVSNLQTGAL